MQNNNSFRLEDYGPDPLIINIDKAADANRNFRTALWTGDNLQVTLMCIPVDSDIGAEVHEDTDQLIKIEQGYAMVSFGRSKNNMRNMKKINCNFAVMVPAGTWHNIINVGNVPLKLYSVYAPPHHPFGTVHRTKADAQRENY